MGQNSSREPNSLGAVTQSVESRSGVLNVTSRYHRLPKQLEDDYELTRTVLGRGYNGTVVRAQSRINSKLVAVKQFKLTGVSKDAREDLLREVEVILSMDHPHIVQLIDVYESDDHLSLVMECMEGGEVFARLTRQKKPFSEYDAADLAVQILYAINYLHAQQVVHRDLKLQNVLFAKKDGNFVKLIDFGFSKFVKKNQRLELACGTMSYVAPEVLNQRYTSQCDMWSFGVCIFTLLFGYMPFRGKDEEQAANIMKGDYDVRKPLWDKVSNSAQDFVRKLLIVDPNKRLSPEGALAHDWITQREKLNQGCSQEIADSLCNFAQSSTFKRACMSVMAWSLTAQDQEIVRDAFLEMDKDRNGTITLGEFKQVLEDRFHVSDEDATTAFKAIDIHHDEQIQYQEFLSAMISCRINMHDDLLLASFRRFDIDGSGFISHAELSEMLRDHFSEEEVNKLMEEADQSQDGQLDYQEWVNYLCNGDAPEPVITATARFLDRKLKEKKTAERFPLRPITKYIQRMVSFTSNTEEKTGEQQKSCCAVQ